MAKHIGIVVVALKGPPCALPAVRAGCIILSLVRRRTHSMKRTTALIGLSLFISVSAFAQQAAAPARREPQPVPLFFKEGWKDTAAIPVTQAGVANPDLELKIYGATKDDMSINNEGSVPHVWTGLCQAGCAIVLRHKESYADLTGKARVRWLTKTSGFHQIRPIVKLADGTYLVGDHADAYTFDFRTSEF